jgi:hypothetical protein
MKINTAECQSFKPFSLIITVESEAELAALWLRFNASNAGVLSATTNFSDERYRTPVRDYVKKHHDARNSENAIMLAWEFLDDQIVNLINRSKIAKAGS